MTVEEMMKALEVVNPQHQKTILQHMQIRFHEIEDTLKEGDVGFNVRCYFCTTGVQVAISAAVGVAFAGLVVGGEVAAEALAGVLAPIIGCGIMALADFIVSDLKDGCSGPGELVSDIANWICKC